MCSFQLERSSDEFEIGHTISKAAVVYWLPTSPGCTPHGLEQLRPRGTVYVADVTQPELLQCLFIYSYLWVTCAPPPLARAAVKTPGGVCGQGVTVVRMDVL